MSFNDSNPTKSFTDPPSPPPPYDKQSYLPPPELPFEGSFIPPSVTLNCPRGLESLSHTDRLIIQLKDEHPVGVFRSVTKSIFSIKNGTGQMIYSTIEDSENAPCCEPGKPFELLVNDNQEQEVLRFSRSNDCVACCFPCFLQRLEVTATGTKCGHIEQVWAPFRPKFKVCNAAGDTVLRVEGPLCVCNGGGHVEFKILSGDGDLIVGRITKRWCGPVREIYANGDHINIVFPIDLDVQIKAILLGACFLFEHMYFQKSDPVLSHSIN